MKFIKTIFLLAIITCSAGAQSVDQWRLKFQSDYDTTLFKPHMIANGWGHSYVVAYPTLWYTADTSNYFQKFADSFLIRVEGQTSDNKRQGIFTYSLIDKANSSKTYKLYRQSFKDDQLSGSWESFSLDGKLVMRNNYLAGKQIGLQQFYKSDGKTLISETEIIKNGEYIEREYYASGRLMTETPYLRNKPHGIGKKFYENGQIEDFVEFKYGNLDGLRKYYHDNGQLWVEELYIFGRPWDILANYDKEGKTRDGGTLKDGTGTQIFYNEDGTIRETKQYKNGSELE